MFKARTFPTLYDDCKRINISDLKRWGYLEPDQYKTGAIGWSANGKSTSSISITVNTIESHCYIQLTYQCNNTDVNYPIKLGAIPSNLGKGVVWYFICPKTNKRCRKIYLVNTYFYHRIAFKGMYEKQTYSHKSRKMNEFFDKVYVMDKVNEELNKRYFRKTYNGCLTKRYQRLQKKIEWANEISISEINSIFS